jgi:hypothetical protein
VTELVRSVTADDFVLAPLTGDDAGVLDLVLLAHRPGRGR